MKSLLKNAREQKGLKTREVAQLLSIDQALVSKFESGTRKPTKDQITKLAALLEINFETLMIVWLKEKIIHEIGQEEFALQALKDAEAEIITLRISSANKISPQLQKLLDEIDVLKLKTEPFSPIENTQFIQTLELEYTFESNRLEGNTLTLSETDLVVNEGQTITGKNMREHMEALNHIEAIAFIKNLIDKNLPLNEKEFTAIHSLILRGVLPKEAGQYRKIPFTVKENSFTPSEPSKIQKEMEALFNWYEMNRSTLHPIILATEMQQRILAIYPFTNGNGKVSRLIMNLVLLQNGYLIANIKGDSETRMQYYQKLENALTGKNKEDFILFIAQIEKENIARYITFLSQ
ncbi:Fic family protein [Flavobacterium degerlachei]|jgi:Fic family protein|uniref:Helix-turn-helix n=1 Tax=Flavobacterium degerlachei TaxID=229203 RepID=A0A1H3GIB9_9FLAO|nr:Fic family protein [Flavobacterium degerlachei]SDY03112.1 Helix-turn-helix [Flavobacterium degerlachei]